MGRRTGVADEGVNHEDHHHADWHEHGEEVDERAALEHAQYGKGESAQKHGDYPYGDEHRGHHAERDTVGEAIVAHGSRQSETAGDQGSGKVAAGLERLERQHSEQGGQGEVEAFHTRRNDRARQGADDAGGHSRDLANHGDGHKARA